MRGDSHLNARLLLHKSALQVGRKGSFFFFFLSCYLLKRIGDPGAVSVMINGKKITCR